MTGTRIRAAAASFAALATLTGLTLAAPAAGAAQVHQVAQARGAAPGRAATGAATASAVPPVWPTPQQETVRPGQVAVPAVVTEVTGTGTDQPALSALASLLRAHGVRTIRQVTAGHPVPPGGLAIYVGTLAGNPAIAPVTGSLGAPDPGSTAGGYVLAAGRASAGDAIVLAGADGAGTFYAVQTLRQLIIGRTLPDVVIKDWPSVPLRGTIEGFYGPSWSDADIASQLRFYGANKLNTFVYSAKNDPYLRANWQDQYPAAQLNELRQLVTDASDQHVNFVYALSPGLSICYSNPADLAALEAKDQQLWEAGVRQFAVFFDDISTNFTCPGDTAMFGSSPDPAAAAQAYLLNAFDKDFIATHAGAQQLITVPTDYSGVANSAYRGVWKASLSPDVLVYWTGVGVIPPTITAVQVQTVAGQFGHQIAVWDNYPVNDYQPTRLFLGPLTGRAADVPTAAAGFTSNPMQEAAPSVIPEFTTADYTWNPVAYDQAPDTAWTAGIRAYGGRAASALQVFADDNQSTPRIGTLPEAPTLAAAIAAFWAADQAGAGSAITPDLAAAAAKLTAQWRQVAAAPATIERWLPHPDFVAQAKPWLTKFGDDGQAGVAAVRYVLDTKAGRGTTADEAALDRYFAAASAIPQVVGEGVFEKFLLTADPGLFKYTVRLYAADPGSASAAQAAASSAGLPADQVTQSFADAWNATNAGEFLVISVGGAATSALYYNQCGWTAPDGLPGGSTPFAYVVAPQHTLPPMNEFLNGMAATAPDTATRVADLAYYAVHGSLPPGVTAPPAAAAPARACSGQPGS
ncbi:MAG TPA: beta-N-acetylglucosaminidase domain-containing protein [Streptosporangiaceae bacterium]|nr:beta-N-acetylglucosaminidase domain-containing protein [Streptosporangiaceae bacterium]